MMPRMPGKTHRRERSRQNHRPDAGEPTLRRQNPLGRRMPRAGGARQDALPHAWRRRGVRRAKGKPERAQARDVHQRCDGRAEGHSGVVGGGAEAAGGDEVIGFANTARICVINQLSNNVALPGGSITPRAKPLKKLRLLVIHRYPCSKTAPRRRPSSEVISLDFATQASNGHLILSQTDLHTWWWGSWLAGPRQFDALQVRDYIHSQARGSRPPLLCN
ncbi:hypothetical protein ACVIGA_002606 [Bradyrhizobium sp. USDA 3240]